MNDSTDDESDDCSGCCSNRDGTANTPLTPSAVFGVLSTKQNRFVLYLLKKRAGTVSYDELATNIAALENDTKPDLLTREMEEQVQNRLYHAIVPKLAEHGFVTTTENPEAVTLTELGQELEPYLGFAKQRERDEVRRFLDLCERDV